MTRLLILTALLVCGCDMKVRPEFGSQDSKSDVVLQANSLEASSLNWYYIKTTTETTQDLLPDNAYFDCPIKNIEIGHSNGPINIDFNTTQPLIVVLTRKGEQIMLIEVKQQEEKR